MKSKDLQNVIILIRKFFAAERVILGLGVLFRFYFIFFKTKNIDEFTSIGHISDLSMMSIFWDNHPPFFYFIGKIINYFPGELQVKMQVFIFLCSCASLYLLSRLVAKSFPKVSNFLLAVFPVTLVNSTLLRPNALIELLTVINFTIFLSILQNSLPTMLKKIAWIFTSILLLMTTYTALLYFAVLIIILTQSKHKELSKSIKYSLAFFAISAVATSFFIEWSSLGWIRSTSLAKELVAGLYLARNLVGYSWISFAATIFLILKFKDKKSIFLVSMVLLINPVLSLEAIEPRFIYVLVPVLLYFLFDLAARVSSKKILYLLFCFYSIGFLWLTVWYTKTPKSGVEAARAWLQSNHIGAIDSNVSMSAIRQLFPDTVPLRTQSQICFSRLGIFSPVKEGTNDVAFSFSEIMAMGYSLKETKIFYPHSLESVKAYLYERNCL